MKGRSGFERDGSFSTDREAGWQYYDCGIACQTLCLAAHDLGLGTVVMGVFDRKGLEAYLQIPEDQELMALIALGYPDESPRRSQAQGDLPRFSAIDEQNGKEDLSVRQVLSFCSAARSIQDLPKKRSRYKNRLMKSRYN